MTKIDYLDFSIYEGWKTMGWDCYATKNGKDLLIDLIKMKNMAANMGDTVDTVFTRAAAEVRKDYGLCDGLLDVGGLDCSDCAEALEAACNGLNCYQEEDMTPEEVRTFNENACWDKNQCPALTKMPKELVASAQVFLRVCAENGYGISFSF